MGKIFFFFSSVDETKILLSWHLAIFIIFLSLDVYDGVHQLQIFLLVHTLKSSFSTNDGGVHCPYILIFTFIFFFMFIFLGLPDSAVSSSCLKRKPILTKD